MARVTITWEGLNNAISHLENVSVSVQDKIERQTAQLARDGQNAWRNATPVRTGRLMGGDRGIPGGLEIEFMNNVFYYKFLDEGHMTPAGWHTKHGYRPAKRRSHVAGKFMTEKLVEFLEGNVDEYLRQALDEFTD